MSASISINRVRDYRTAEISTTLLALDIKKEMIQTTKQAVQRMNSQDSFNLIIYKICQSIDFSRKHSSQFSRMIIPITCKSARSFTVKK